MSRERFEPEGAADWKAPQEGGGDKQAKINELLQNSEHIKDRLGYLNDQRTKLMTLEDTRQRQDSINGINQEIQTLMNSQPKINHELQDLGYEFPNQE